MQLTNPVSTERLAALTTDDIMQVYSGKPGCRCGCNGKYSVNPKYLAEANKDRGYDHDPEDLNLTQVKRVLNILKKHPNMVDDFGIGLDLRLQTGESRNGFTYRDYTVYFVPSAA